MLLNPKTALSLTKASAKAWSEDKASRLAAALSYYTIFSIAPLLVLAIAVAGIVFGREAASHQLFGEIRGLVGDQGAQAIQTMVQSVNQKGGSVLATIIGIATLLLGASGAFGQLQDALNTIWQVQPKPGQGIMGFLRTRFLSFSMVLVIGFMLLVTLVVSAALAAVSHYLEGILPIPAPVLQLINFAISFGVTALLFTLIYKVLPDVTVRWRDVWIGGMVTAFLFSIGRYLIGLYLGRGSVSSAYGAAGSLVILLLWIYYSAQILFFGAEFTKVFANRFGSHIMPSPHAEAISEQARREQGMPKPSSENPVQGRGRAPVPDDGKPREAGMQRHRPQVEVHRSGVPLKVSLRSERPLLVLLGGTLGFLAFRGLARPGVRAALSESLRPGEKRVRLSDLVSIASSAAWLIQRWRKRGLG
jgi:membrane protein